MAAATADEVSPEKEWRLLPTGDLDAPKIKVSVSQEAEELILLRKRFDNLSAYIQSLRREIAFLQARKVQSSEEMQEVQEEEEIQKVENSFEESRATFNFVQYVVIAFLSFFLGQTLTPQKLSTFLTDWG